MTIRFIRLFFVALSVFCGYYLGPLFFGVLPEAEVIGAAAGFIGALIIIVLESKARSVSLRNLSAAAFGLMFGVFIAWIISLILRLIPMEQGLYSAIQIIITLVLSYLGMVITIKGKDEFNIVVPYVRFTRQDQRDQLLILDTSVIIDGRISGLCETGFLEGIIVIPRFVLQELQQIADSPDSEKRNRGRRGLDMVDRIKGIEGIEVVVHGEGFSGIKDVDAKLVRLAKILDCPIMTNDFNLNKVAKIEGVKVLNMNDLAGAMRPVVFPGEELQVHIRKEGKEKNQGVGYLDDGTMIVVDNARRSIGKAIKVNVTSVLQTSAGRMIFATPREDRNDKNKNSRS
jgi:uncharacterized protein YacL